VQPTTQGRAHIEGGTANHLKGGGRARAGAGGAGRSAPEAHLLPRAVRLRRRNSVDLTGVVQQLRSGESDVDRVHVGREGGGARTITVGLHLPAGQPPEDVAARVGSLPGVRDVDWTR